MTKKDGARRECTKKNAVQNVQENDDARIECIKMDNTCRECTKNYDACIECINMDNTCMLVDND